MERLAVVLGGGGARGAYQIGVWKALRKLGVTFSIVTGSSVGALNGALMAQGDYRLASRMWRTLTLADVVEGAAHLSVGDIFSELVTAARLLPQGGLDTGPLEAVVRRCVDEERVRRSPVELGIITTRFPMLRPVELTKGEIPPGELADYLLASSAWYPVFRRHTIGGAQYIDGAYADNLPARLALDCGATRLIVVDLQGTGIVRAYRGDVPVTYIRCHWNLGDMLGFGGEGVDRLIRLGYYDTLRAHRRLEGRAYAFRTGETARNVRALAEAMALMRSRTGIDPFRDYRRLPRLQDTLGHRAGDNRFLPRDSRPCTPGCAVTTAAEIAGELLGVAPERIYTFPRFNRLLLERQRALRLPQAGENRATAALRGLLDMLWRSYERGHVTGALWRLGALAPAALEAACYLMVLELSLRRPSP